MYFISIIIKQGWYACRALWLCKCQPNSGSFVPWNFPNFLRLWCKICFQSFVRGHKVNSRKDENITTTNGIVTSWCGGLQQKQSCKESFCSLAWKIHSVPESTALNCAICKYNLQHLPSISYIFNCIHYNQDYKTIPSFKYPFLPASPLSENMKP